VIVALTGGTVSTTDLTDVSTGAGGSEVVIISDIIGDNPNNTTTNAHQCQVQLPCAIASGTRIAARCQSATASGIVRITLTLIAAGGVAGQTTFTTYGDVTASSRGTQLDPGGTANTKGSYAALTASSSAIAQWIAMVASSHANTSTASINWMLDVATGAGGAEVVLIPDLQPQLACSGALSGSSFNTRSCEFLTFIAASTRIAARVSCSTNSATVRILDAAMYACVAPSEPAGGTGGAWAYA
jgi:hypothetical protein